MRMILDDPELRVNEHSHRWWRAILYGVALACAACAPPNKQVGSACRNGVCPAALATAPQMCVASEVATELYVTTVEGSPLEQEPHALCLPRPLIADAHGQVRCSVLWKQPVPDDPRADSSAHCSDWAFLSPGPEANECWVDQVGAPSSTDASAASGEGWYYVAHDSECAHGAASVRFTDGAWPRGVTMLIRCPELQTNEAPRSAGALPQARADAGVSTDSGVECTLPAANVQHASAVGDKCSPAFVPQGGFSDREVYLETGASDCGTGACLVYHVTGDPRSGCAEGSDAGCADAFDIDQRIFCTCRCAAPGVDPIDLCTCGEGFSCVDTLGDAPEGLRGSYCVRDGTFSPL